MPVIQNDNYFVIMVLFQLLGRNVHPVSMLSYIPETPVVPDPRVIAVRKVDDNLVESSESPDELDSVPKKRRQKVIWHCALLWVTH